MSKENQQFDLIVIGSGPGGEGAAIQAAKGGLRVALIEKNMQLGGNCTHLGTIPSKALRHMAQKLTSFQNDPLFAPMMTQRVPFHEMMDHSRDIISKQVQVRSNHYLRNDIEILHGHARIVDPHTVVVDKGIGLIDRLSTKYIIIATGSRPFHPPDIDFSHPRVFDSDSILDLRDSPKIITVYGAGVVGCEYTSIFRSLGKKVNLINTRAKLLSFLDDEIIDALSYHLRDQGVVIRHNEMYDIVETHDDHVVMTLKSGKKIKTDALLFAIGRIGNSKELGLEDLQIETSERGYILVNEKYQTSIPNIFAVGDVTGFPSLASAAYDQGRFASLNILNPKENTALQDMPLGIYTSPEISCMGKTEQELTAAKVPYEVGHAHFRHLARAQITGETVGMLKILFHREDLSILGIHCFGQNATEIVHIGQPILLQKGPGNTLKYFANTTFNYPTMAEAYRVAALNGLNRVYST
ncbi:MAG: Si-specific NAD(P)(+) transhydrogenase [Oligoflexales bacterium]|nr:Si-specific NAD(P)(+) transhydrogenase [Oligoflexales bacterium]